jgi:hypothetical protein
VGNGALNFVDIEGYRKHPAYYLTFTDDDFKYPWYDLRGIWERGEWVIFGTEIDVSGEQERKARAMIGESIIRPDGGQIDIHQYNRSYGGTAMQRGTIEGLATANFEFYGMVSPVPLVGTVGRRSGHRILAQVDVPDRLATGVAAAKPSQKSNTIIHVYVNPGTHVPNHPNFIKGKSILPENHLQLFEKSVIVKDGNGRPIRWAREGKSRDAIYHRFEPSIDHEYHWTCSTDPKSNRPFDGPVPRSEIDKQLD